MAHKRELPVLVLQELSHQVMLYTLRVYTHEFLRQIEPSLLKYRLEPLDPVVLLRVAGEGCDSEAVVTMCHLPFHVRDV